MKIDVSKASFKRNAVFAVSAVITAVLVLWAIVGADSFSATADSLMSSLKENFDWLYIWGATMFVLFSIVIALTPFGKKRLGRDDEHPERSTLSWFALLFSAGMGIGLVFWGTAEPLSHYVAPMAGYEPLTDEAARFSIRSSFMHWGVHPWSGYAVVGLCLGYFSYRLGKKSLISSTTEPLLRKAAHGVVGTIIDIYATLLTVIGVATSFGMGCLQISAGLNYLGGIPNGPATWAILTAVICVVYTWSAVSGLENGMQKLGNFTLALCAVLLALVFIVEPHVPALRMLCVGVGDYITNFFQDSLRMAADNGDPSWIRAWRVFYWAWWISWAPFVGVFIARISRGRTIREFVLGVIIAPTVLSAIWFTVFGEAAFNATSNMTADQMSAIVASPETAPFAVFSHYPLAMVLSIIALVLLFAFFVTSANSAAYVLSMLSSDGSQHPPRTKRVVWCVLIALVAFALVFSGGVAGIQTIAVVISFPFFFIMVVMCISLVMALAHEKKDPSVVVGNDEEEEWLWWGTY